MEPGEEVAALQAMSTGRSRAVLKAIYKLSPARHEKVVKAMELQKLLSRQDRDEAASREPLTQAIGSEVSVTAAHGSPPARPQIPCRQPLRRTPHAEPDPLHQAKQWSKRKQPAPPSQPDAGPCASVRAQTAGAVTPQAEASSSAGTTPPEMIITRERDGLWYLFGDEKPKEVIEPLPDLSDEHARLAELFATLTRHVSADTGHEISRAERKKKKDLHAKGCVDLGYGEASCPSEPRVVVVIRSA